MPDLDPVEVTPEDERRLARIAAALLNGDGGGAASVALETYTDPRGFEVAIFALVIGAATALSIEWVKASDKETVLDAIQVVLLKDAADSADGSVQHG